MNYREYHFKPAEYMKYFICCVFVILALSYLFYGKAEYGIFLSPVAVLMMHIIRNHLKNKRDMKLRQEFASFIRALTDSLRTGFSVENGFKECEKELELLYGKNSLLNRELKKMNRRIDLNENIESVVEEFALRTDVEDIRLFSQVFSVANKTGGRVNRMMKMVSDSINDRLIVSKEIEVSVYEKKLEQIIMIMVPPAIILYLKATSQELVELLYFTFAGKAVMTISLAVYILSVCLAYYIISEKAPNSD